MPSEWGLVGVGAGISGGPAAGWLGVQGEGPVARRPRPGAKQASADGRRPEIRVAWPVSIGPNPSRFDRDWAQAPIGDRGRRVGPLAWFRAAALACFGLRAGGGGSESGPAAAAVPSLLPGGLRA